MEIAQLCKNAYNNQLQQSIYLWYERNRVREVRVPLKYGVQRTT